MSVKIIVDSTTDVTKEIKERLEIVPLTVRFGEEEYVDGVTIDHQMFYEKLIESDVLPTTSQANPASFAEVFERIAATGDEAVVITVSAQLSGTYQSALIAAADYEGRIFVVDGKSVAIGTGVLAELALRMADEGMCAKDIAQCLKEEREHIGLIAMLDTLEYLMKGGRISKVTAFAGGVLNIKPVVCIRGGEIIVLGYTGLRDLLLKKYIKDSTKFWENSVNVLRYTPIGSVVGTHAGPGAIAAAFIKKK